jgi:hypothetical protein
MLLERELDRLGFDPVCDRVLSVGDLIDRGPESLQTLLLLEEPWFHAVVGIHELMLLNYLDYYSSRIHCKRSFPAGSGSWINDALSHHRKLVSRMADRIASLPLSLHVDSQVAFNVMHGDLHPIGSRQECLFRHETIGVHKADCITSSRTNINQALKSDSPAPGSRGIPSRSAKHPSANCRSPMSAIPGSAHHGPQPYVYIDQVSVCGPWDIRIRGRRRCSITPSLPIGSQASRERGSGVSVEPPPLRGDVRPLLSQPG